MLSNKEQAEIKGATNSELRAIAGAMGRQVKAPLFIGDRVNAALVKAAAIAELERRERLDVMNYCDEGCGGV